MYWQILLTIWIIFQMFCKIYSHLNNYSNSYSKYTPFIGVFGNFSWAAGMLACLYFGGFYK